MVGGGGSPRGAHGASVISEGVELPETAALITNTPLMSLGRGSGVSMQTGAGLLGLIHSEAKGNECPQ